jgi:hypothetical protein
MANSNKLAPPNRNMLRDANGGYYYAPALPSFDVMQQAAVPNYKLQMQPNKTNSWVKSDTPNVAYIGDMFTDGVKKTPEQILKTKGHELQHQIEQIAQQKGQVKDNAVISAWRENAQQLGYDPFRTEEGLKKLLAQPEVSNYFKSLGAGPKSRIMNPEKSSLDEVLADLSAYQTLTKQKLTDNPILSKYVFQDPKLAQLVNSTTGMSGFVVGDSDYAPYSLGASRAWGYQPPQTTVDKIKGFFSK